MANIKSSKKRILTSQRNAEKNVAFKSSIKTAMKKALELGKGGESKYLQEAVAKVYQLCDKAVGKGILHKNTAARKKSRLVIALKKIVEKAETAPKVEKVEKPVKAEKAEKPAKTTKPVKAKKAD
jgi:small subunit ribosomal protein S20